MPRKFRVCESTERRDWTINLRVLTVFLYVFPYSPEPGTTGVVVVDLVPKDRP
jgi:hypothetical protein